ncbi:MAG TPA: hemolysin family protein [Candidatus Saccharimonadales bacterium]|nr:hemolysin family protein [Candidatus Saccharimonadales bacterium]
MILVLLVGGLALAAFFDALDTALLSANRYRMKHLAEHGRADARAVVRALGNPMLLPGTTLVGVNLGVVVATSAAALWSLGRFGRWGPVWADVAMTPLVLVLTEILPKAYGRKHADRLALGATRALEILYYALYALTWAVTVSSRAVLRALGAGRGSPRFLFSRDELEALVSESERAGAVEPEQGRILSSVFVFGETRLTEVMVPRTQIAAVEKTQTLRETLHAFRRHGFSRMPVYDEHPDRIVGMVHVFDLFRVEDWDQTVETALHPVLFAPEAKKCDDLLREMQLKHVHLAVVLDEYGGTAGIVGFEDLVEELVGEIADEHEEDQPEVRAEGPGAFLADARAKVDEVNERLGLALPEGDYETLGGLLLDRLGRIPRRGEKLALPGLELEVTLADRRRVKQVRLRRLAEPEA